MMNDNQNYCLIWMYYNQISSNLVRRDKNLRLEDYKISLKNG